MSNPSVTHETIAIKRAIKAPCELVFKAWADPEARAKWGPPSSDEAIEFLESDFRAGGIDVSLCGSKDDLRYRVETRYLDISVPNQLLFAEVVKTGGTLLCASLITVDLTDEGSGTTLNLTVQVTSLVGKEMIEGNRAGWCIAVENLDRFLVADCLSART